MATQDFDPNRAQNLPEIEKQMAVKCVEQVSCSTNARGSQADGGMHRHKHYGHCMKRCDLRLCA